MIEVEFRNVTITVANVDSAKDAYDQLCEALGQLEKNGVLVDWTTDTYVINPTQLEDTWVDERKERPTSDLWPDGILEK